MTKLRLTESDYALLHLFLEYNWLDLYTIDEYVRKTTFNYTKKRLEKMVNRGYLERVRKYDHNRNVVYKMSKEGRDIIVSNPEFLDKIVNYERNIYNNRVNLLLTTISKEKVKEFKEKVKEIDKIKEVNTIINSHTKNNKEVFYTFVSLKVNKRQKKTIEKSKEQRNYIKRKIEYLANNEFKRIKIQFKDKSLTTKFHFQPDQFGDYDTSFFTIKDKEDIRLGAQTFHNRKVREVRLLLENLGIADKTITEKFIKTVGGKVYAYLKDNRKTKMEKFGLYPDFVSHFKDIDEEVAVEVELNHKKLETYEERIVKYNDSDRLKDNKVLYVYPAKKTTIKNKFLEALENKSMYNPEKFYFVTLEELEKMKNYESFYAVAKNLKGEELLLNIEGFKGLAKISKK